VLGTFAFCDFEQVDWPCDTAVVLAALDSQMDRNRIEAKRLWAAQDGFALSERVIADAIKKLDAARADADALAEHLRNDNADLIGDWELLGGPQMRYAEADAALAAHDATKADR
jgi:hypothetical protein